MRRQALTVAPSTHYQSARTTAPRGKKTELSRKISPAHEGHLRPSHGNFIPTDELPKLTGDWLLDCEYRLHSPETIGTRRVFLKGLAWFLEHRG